MKFYEVGFNRYHITMNISNNEILIAELSTPLISMDTVYLTMYFPYEECSKIKIDITHIYYKDILEIIKKIIIKKMYKAQQDILKGIQLVEFDDDKYNGKYSVSDNFARGRVFAVK